MYTAIINTGTSLIVLGMLAFLANWGSANSLFLALILCFLYSLLISKLFGEDKEDDGSISLANFLGITFAALIFLSAPLWDEKNYCAEQISTKLVNEARTVEDVVKVRQRTDIAIYSDSKNCIEEGGWAYKLRYGLKDTPCWGAYLTDIVKNFPEPDSNKVLKHLKENPDFLEENINLFRDEISDLGSVNPRVFAFGDAAFKILDDIPKKEFTLTKLIHYSYRFQGFSNQETYKKYLHEQIYS